MTRIWRPDTLGEVIAHRSCQLVQGKRKSNIHLRLGKPVQEPAATRNDPWHCPLSISGRAIPDEFFAVAGIDSFQALILALSLASDRIPTIAEKARGRIVWLDEEERVILGRHVLSGAAEDALYAMVARFSRAAAILDPGSTASSSRQRDRAVNALKAVARNTVKRGPKAPRGNTTGRRKG